MSGNQTFTLAQSDRILKIVQVAFGLHMVFMVFMAERMRKPDAQYPREFEIPFALVGVGLVAAFFFLRNRLPHAEALIQANLEDRVALGKRQQLHIIMFAISEALVMFGFVARFLGASVSYAAAFYAAGILLLLLSSPRKLD